MTVSPHAARATAVLLVVATVAALVASEVVPDLTGDDVLAQVGGHPHRVAVAGLAYLVAAATSAGVAVVLRPLLRRVAPTLALAAVVFRTVEAVGYSIAVVWLLALRPLAARLADASEAEPAMLRTAAASLVAQRDLATLVGVFAFCTGALLYGRALYVSQVVPRWLASWGIGAALAMLAACVLALFQDRPITGYSVLILPIAIQEMAFAVWLFARGAPSAA